LPGAGHLYLGRVRKGFVLLAAIGILFTMGVALGARLQMYFGLDDPLALLRSMAQVGNGIGYFLARWLGFEAGRVTAPTHEYGNTFTEVGGLLNVLLILDVHDIAVGRKP